MTWIITNVYMPCRWKESLPTRWGHAKVSKGDYPMKMDPNLTAAYLIHNASIILLHQYIAYPPSDLSSIIKLPSSYSSHTCMLAAAEVSSILKRLLSSIDFLMPAQLAYCAFISARIFLGESFSLLVMYGRAKPNNLYSKLAV